MNLVLSVTLSALLMNMSSSKCELNHKEKRSFSDFQLYLVGHGRVSESFDDSRFSVDRLAAVDLRINSKKTYSFTKGQ